MVQMIGEVGSTQRFSAVLVSGAGANPADPYRADWQAPRPTPVASVAGGPVDTGRSASTVATDPTRSNRNALLAADVYLAEAKPPAGTRVAIQGDLDRLGLTPEMLEQPGQSDFRARVYVSGSEGHEQYTVAFRGTQSGDDWKANFRQGTGQDSIHYRSALAIGHQIARSGASVEMTGHSLGGGLASAAALAAGRHATTFNAAGLHDKTIAQANGIAAGAGQRAGSADNYRVQGEILTFVQEGGDRMLGGLLGGALGAIFVDAPPAFGRQHELDLVVPDGKGFLDSHSRIDRHGMEWVLASTGSRLTH